MNNWRDEIRKYGEYLKAKGATEKHISDSAHYFKVLGEAYEPESFLDLGQMDMINWTNALRDKGLKETSLKAIFSFIKAFFRYLNEGDTPASLKGMSIGKSEYRVKSPSELIMPEEFERFLAALPTQKRAIFRLIRTSGARPSEVLHLKTGDIAWDTFKGRQRLLLTFRETKTGMPRTVPLRDAKTHQALKDYLAIAPSDGWLFPSPRKTGGPLTHQSLWVCMKRTADQLGMKKKMYPYLLRHTKASELMNAPRAVADEMMGWKSGVMWKRYTHLSVDNVSDWEFRETEGEELSVEETREMLETLILRVASDPTLAKKLKSVLK